MMLSGRFLEAHDVIASHYGVIDRVARDPRKHLAQGGVTRFEQIYGVAFAEARVVGAVRYLEERPEVSPEELSDRWLEEGYEKLAGGSYCLHLESEGLFVFNGFYPQLLRHYTREAARIVVFVLSGDPAWAAARRSLIGSTDPAAAETGSIRRELLESADELRLSAVTPNLNGVHLSAGPVEAVVELIRFTDDRTGAPPSYGDFTFGETLLREFSVAATEAILSNPDVVVDGATVSIFDLTEELDADEAIRVLSAVRGRIGGG